MSLVILGIELGKDSCSIAGLDADGTAIVRRRMRRDGVIAFAAKPRPCTMAMDACRGAHHTGRSLADHWPVTGRSRAPGPVDVGRVRAALRDVAEER